jgi:microcystin-dependent protein
VGQDIQKGTIYAEGGVGGAGTVNADNLNAHVDEARIKASFISGKSLRDPGSLSDSIVVEAGGVLYRETLQQVIDLINTTIQGLLPIGTIVDFAGANAPNGWLLCFGQLVSRTTYSDLFDMIGTTYSVGDGVSTFGIPDLRGRLAAGKDDMGGTAAGRVTSPSTINGSALGAAGGTQTQTMTIAQMPVHAHTVPDHNHTYTTWTTYQSMRSDIAQQACVYWPSMTTANTGGSGTFSTTNQGSGSAHPNLQPTIILNKIIRCQ